MKVGCVAQRWLRTAGKLYISLYDDGDEYELEYSSSDTLKEIKDYLLEQGFSSRCLDSLEDYWTR